MSLRSTALIALSLAFAAQPATAQDSNQDPSAAPASATAQDAVAGRIKYLHDRMRVTAEQAQLWEPVAQAIRDSAGNTAPLLKERFRATTNGTALDVLRSYESLGQTQLDSLQKFITAFDAFYGSLSDAQKKIADAILREGPLQTMIVGIPEVPAPFGPRLTDSWSGAVPAFVLRPIGHTHGLGRLHR
jgi:periplasmic protein CpxP/Spy